MTVRRVGKRHPLLLYRRSMDRLWPSMLLLALILLALWAFGTFPFGEMLSKSPLSSARNLPWLLAAGLLLLLFSIFLVLARYAAYVQPFSDHLRVITPFLRLHISFRRVRNIHPADFHVLFPIQEVSWTQRSYLEPFYGKTAVVVELHSFPISPIWLRLFLAQQMFYRQGTGLVLLVPDWIGFSTELDTFRAAWMQNMARKRKS